jgi:DNA mismatch endonuclease (patch repair protein)
MPDVFSRRQRSKVMAACRGKGNRSTEARFRAALAAHGVAGWKMHSPSLPGRPDFVFAHPKIAVFVDGCFWHGCRECEKTPASNTGYWLKKIAGNRRRDRKITRALRSQGWLVVRLWEHDLRHRLKKCVAIIQRALKIATVS